MDNLAKGLFAGIFLLIGASNQIDSSAFSKQKPVVQRQAKTVQLAQLQIERATGRRTLDGQAFTGTATSLHPNGHQSAKEEFIDGRRHGKLKKWFESGRLAFTSTYKAGRRNGNTISWWSNGRERSRTLYIDDQPEGEALRWYRGGEKFKRFNYAGGKPVGLQQAWRLNGKLFSNFEIRNGRAYGLRNSNMCIELDNEELSI